MPLTPADEELLRGRNFAHFATLEPDGSPHSTVLWVDTANGFVLVNTAVGRRKDRNVRRDPRISVSVHGQENPYAWLLVLGTVEEMVEGDEAERHIDFLSRKYHDEAWEYVAGQRRVMYRIRPDRVIRSGA